MPNYTEFIAIYRTELIEPPFSKVIVDPVKIEIVAGSKVIRVPVFMGGAIPAGRERQLAEERDLMLPGGATYLVVTARVDPSRPFEAEAEGEDRLDRILAALAVIYTPDLLSQPVYRGFVASGNTRQVSGWVRLVKPFSVDCEEVVSAVTGGRRRFASDPDLDRRYGLMSRFLVKAAAYPPCEERFVLLWTILEVFPMKDTTDIAPVSEFLHQLTGHPADVLKEQLGIGRLFGARSRLVHDGVLPIPIGELGEALGRLEAICTTVVRGVAGLPYAGSLEQHFASVKRASA